MKIMVPTNNVRQVGLREVISKSKVEKVFKILKEKTLSVETTTWNRRYREYMVKIKTGSVFEVAEVLRDLYILKIDKDLSFCELKLLDTARGLLIRELAPDLLVKGADYKRKDVVGGDFVEEIGGKVLLVELESGYSTSDTIAKIVGSHDD